MLVFLRIAELAIGTSPAKRNDELERIKSFRPGVAAINLVVRLPYGASPDGRSDLLQGLSKRSSCEIWTFVAITSSSAQR